MSSQQNFQYTYSASKNQEVQRIREKYLPRQRTQLEELQALDKKVRRPAQIFAYIYGSVSAVIMGIGMSLVMTDIGDLIGLPFSMVPGVIIGLVGIYMAISTWPIYRKMLHSRKKKYAPEILKLSDLIMQG